MSEPNETGGAVEMPQAEATVRSKTGRGWDDWFAVLDAHDAARLSHGDMVRLLASLHPGVSSWWQQTLVVGYERARGLRERNQAASGFQLSASRTLRVPVERLFAAWADPEARRRWLPEADLSIRIADAPRVVRGASEGDARVEAYFYARGEGRSQVAVSETRRPDAETVARRKAYWKARLDDLAAGLAAEAGGP